jgi:hypothetical protein
MYQTRHQTIRILMFGILVFGILHSLSSSLGGNIKGSGYEQRFGAVEN